MKKANCLALSLLSPIIIFSILFKVDSSPLYNVYQQDEPQAIPLHFFKLSAKYTNNDNSDAAYPIKTYVSQRNSDPLKIIHNKRHFSNSESTCCPTVQEITEPTHGKNKNGYVVELFQNERIRQRFHETSCKVGVAEEPCKYLDRKHLSLSACKQDYSYTYALVKELGDSAELKLDYIQIRTGCSCHISPLI